MALDTSVSYGYMYTEIVNKIQEWQDIEVFLARERGDTILTRKITKETLKRIFSVR